MCHKTNFTPADINKVTLNSLLINPQAVGGEEPCFCYMEESEAEEESHFKLKNTF